MVWGLPCYLFTTCFINFIITVHRVLFCCHSVLTCNDKKVEDLEYSVFDKLIIIIMVHN